MSFRSTERQTPFDPNFSTQKADTTRMMVPFFRQFWDMGAKDKATGKSRSDVQQRIQQFHSQEFLNSLQGTTQFAGTDYRSKDLTPKKSRLLADTISAVYLDGYEETVSGFTITRHYAHRSDGLRAFPAATG
ncbi:TPA: Exc2 family lipoprotein [Klebsiella pneumoniae]